MCYWSLGLHQGYCVVKGPTAYLPLHMKWAILNSFSLETKNGRKIERRQVWLEAGRPNNPESVSDSIGRINTSWNRKFFWEGMVR